MLRSNAAYSFTLIARSIASSSLIFVVWEVAHVVFEVYATHVSCLGALSLLAQTYRSSPAARFRLALLDQRQPVPHLRPSL